MRGLACAGTGELAANKGGLRVTVVSHRWPGWGIPRASKPTGREMDAARLKTISVSSELDDESLEAISKLAAEVSVPEGKELVREGDYSYDLIAIEEGTAKVH